jgi:hypothetical protein
MRRRAVVADVISRKSTLLKESAATVVRDFTKAHRAAVGTHGSAVGFHKSNTL